ncbi:MAG: pyridoxal phosphate-dependent aminotransferase [Clostridiales Family XIII bacterium]|jgi:cystathionine beta-lyase|nr:pyridoxal phosphate-dependent aminotransferase [Clostridiales Family XIII bacterium]
MDKYDCTWFDTEIDRSNTNAIKYNSSKLNLTNGVSPFPQDEVIPMWVADMDFRIPRQVSEALHNAVDHGIFGYSAPSVNYFEALNHWFETNHDFHIERGDVFPTPGVVFSISVAIRAFTKPGDSILIQQPVYYPFERTIKANERNLVINELVYDGARYTIDFEDLERKIIDENVKLFLFCSPHNPVSRVWSREELTRLGDICLKYHVLVLSDEIHADFVYRGSKHIVWATLGSAYADTSIICTAPSKTFNLAGIQSSNIIISNPELKRAYAAELDRTGYNEVSQMALVACEAAYRHGQNWKDALIEYLEGNIQLIEERLAGMQANVSNTPAISLVKPEGTYLLWLDCAGLGLTDAELNQFFIEKVGIWVHKGITFGLGGSGFMRINIACPRSLIAEALDRIERGLMADKDNS